MTVLTALSDEEIQKLADSDADESEVRPLVERAQAEFEQAAAEPEEGKEEEAEEEALAEDAAAEGPDDAGPAEESAPVGVKSSEESEAGGEDSEGHDSEES